MGGEKRESASVHACQKDREKGEKRDLLYAYNCFLPFIFPEKAGRIAELLYRWLSLIGVVYLEQYAEMHAVIQSSSMTADSRQAGIFRKPVQWYHTPQPS